MLLSHDKAHLKQIPTQNTAKIGKMFVTIISPKTISVNSSTLYSSGRPGIGNWPAKASTSALISATCCWNFSPCARAWMKFFRGALGSRLLCTSKVSTMPAGERRACRAVRSQNSVLSCHFSLVDNTEYYNTNKPQEAYQRHAGKKIHIALLLKLRTKRSWISPNVKGTD